MDEMSGYQRLLQSSLGEETNKEIDGIRLTMNC